MKWTLRLDGIGEGVASLNGMMLSSRRTASRSNISSSEDSLEPSPASSSLSFSDTLRVSVSIACEMRDFSLAASMLDASRPARLAAVAAASPLFEPFSVELSSSLDESMLGALWELLPIRVSGARGVLGSRVGES